MDSGTESRMPWAYYDPDSSSLRTCQRSLFDDQDSTSLPLILPASGSLRNGLVYARPTSEPRTAGNAGSALLPTPTTSEAGAGNAADGGLNLRTAVSLLPTPAAGNFNDGESVESWQARRSAQKERGINGNGMGTPLAIAVQLLPTPAARDWKTGTSNLIGTNARPLNEVACQLLPMTSPPDSSSGAPTCPDAGTTRGATAPMHPLLPTPMAADGGLNRGSSAGNGLRNVSREIERGETTNRRSAAGSTSSADPRQYLLNLDGEDSPD